MSRYYKMAEKSICDEAGVTHTVYGVKLVNESGEDVIVFADLFFEKQNAERLADICNSKGLSPIHFAEIAEDTVTEQSMV